MQNWVLISRFVGLVLAVTVLTLPGHPARARDRTTSTLTELDRVAYAVDGAESSHGKDARMWRAHLEGPQGPMQVSAKAAIDVGGGDRFDIGENRTIGRAYLALLHRRYGNWFDAVSAYNWGMGNVDGWIRGGRKSERLLPAVAGYLRRVLHESDLCRLENCQAFALRKDGRRFGVWSGLSLRGLEQSGRPLPNLVGSGRPLPVMGQSGRVLPGLEQTGRPLRKGEAG